MNQSGLEVVHSQDFEPGYEESLPAEIRRSEVKLLRNARFPISVKEKVKISVKRKTRNSYRSRKREFVIFPTKKILLQTQKSELIVRQRNRLEQNSGARIVVVSGTQSAPGTRHPDLQGEHVARLVCKPFDFVGAVFVYPLCTHVMTTDNATVHADDDNGDWQRASSSTIVKMFGNGANTLMSIADSAIYRQLYTAQRGAAQRLPDR